MKYLLLLSLLFSISANALEIDEKLTVRILNTSASKKTVMVNRGTEDGLVEGDHAKFIVTAGIVARGVVVRVSPTRSVWSIYRLVNADFVLKDSVMSVKITPPVKITKDDSQTLIQDDTPVAVSGDASTLGIPLADGANDMTDSGQDGFSSADLNSLEGSGPVSIIDKNLEVYGFLNISGLSASTKTDTGSSEYSNSQSSQHIGLGVEWYSRNERAWYSNFSVFGDASVIKEDSQSYNGAGVENAITEFSLGTHWHPFKEHHQSNEFIFYLHAAAHFGTVKSVIKAGDNGGSDAEASGKTSGFSGGAGYKYYTHSGFGMRAQLDFYSRTEAYEADNISALKYNKTVSGPRFMMAASYRF